MIKELKKKNGITLVALIITIIILLILSTIVILELRNTNLFNKTTEARNKYKQAEKMENNTLDDYANKINEIAGGTVTKKVDKTPPEITIKQDSVTEDSITVTATAVDKESGMPAEPTYTFYIKEASAEKYSDEPAQTGTKSTFCATGLNSSTEYNILVITSDTNKNQGSNELKISTAKFQGLMLYNYGDECTATTGGWVAGTSGIWNTPNVHIATKYSDYLYLQHEASNNTGHSVTYFKTSNTIDFSNYKYINAIAEISYTGSIRDGPNRMYAAISYYDPSTKQYNSYESLHITEFAGFSEYCPASAADFYTNRLINFKCEISSNIPKSSIIYCSARGYWNPITTTCKFYKVWFSN